MVKKNIPCLNYVYTRCECDACPLWSLGWDLIFINWREDFCLRSVSTGVYEEGSFNSWCGHIFHWKTLVPRTIDAMVVEVLYINYLDKSSK